ncbi:hypothetical protein P3T25_009594 [Paraburkholderia sp. GAS32]
MIRQSILMLIIGLSMAQHAACESGRLEAFRLVREVVLEKGSLPDPRVIERVNDGGFVIAGRMEKDKAAWAIKVDAAGTVRWRYLLASPNPDVGGVYPDFSGAVATPGGDVLLCGTIDLGRPRKPEINGLLVRLDNEGKLITEQFITPQETENEYSHIAYLDGCIAWNGGAVLVGRVTRYWPGGGQRGDYHWIVAVNFDGTVRWQKLIPSKGGGVRGQVRMMSDGSLIISDTETIRVDAQGEIQARSAATGLLRLVQPLDPQADPQLLDCYGGKSRGRLFQLTDDLQVSKEIALPASDGFMCGPSQYATQVFSLTDGSIVLFGYRYDDGLYTPGAVKWNFPLKSSAARSFAAPPAPWFNAATPSGKPDEFATVRVTGAPTAANRERALYLSFVDAGFDVHARGEEPRDAATTPSMSESTQPGVPRATASQLQRLLVIQQSQSNTPSGIGADANVCVERNLRQIDLGDRAWNPNNPRWAPMRAAIAEDCAAEADRIKRSDAPVLEKTYLDALRQSYGNHLSSAEADTLIRFYESDAGHRYRAFQARLATVAAQGMGRLFGDKASLESRALAPGGIEARMKVLRLSTMSSTLIVATEDDRRAGRAANGAPAIGIMMSVAATSQGDALDQIVREYSADLRGFAAFAESPAEMDELRALHEVSAAATAVAGTFVTELSPELNGDLKRWRDLYNSLPRDKTTAPIK